MISYDIPTHGILLSISGIGVYIIGESGVGKSETALQLIEQGAVLICDDAPELVLLNQPLNQPKRIQTLYGYCPKNFYGLMHIRDIGIINVIELFGSVAFSKVHEIQFVVEMLHTSISTSKQEHESNLISPTIMNQPMILQTPHYQQWCYQSYQIPGIQLNLSPGRNYPLLIKTIVKQFNHTQRQHEKN
jgi:HPr kinase/phosphorylase